MPEESEVFTDEGHEAFAERVKVSDNAVQKVKVWMERKGAKIIIPETRIAPTHQERGDYGDSGDMFRVHPDGSQDRLEVRHLESKVFTSAIDWPHPPHFIVDPVATEARKEIKPLVYICVNKAMTHAGIIYQSTRDKWYIKEFWDKHQPPRPHHTIDVSLVRFIKIVNKP